MNLYIIASYDHLNEIDFVPGLSNIAEDCTHGSHLTGIQGTRLITSQYIHAGKQA